jgi:N-acyl homoserine lactone hydrolase
MVKGIKVWPLLTGTIRYEKTLSTHGRGHGEFIDAPILAYLIETPNGRVLYDAGCDYRLVSDPALRAKYFDPMRPTVEPPQMREEQRIPRYLARLGLSPSDVDLVFVGHLHFDHAGGLCEFPECDVHVHADELTAAHTGMDGSIFADELVRSGDASRWRVATDEYTVTTGIHAVASPGHTAGHMSLFIELQKGRPIILCGDAADLSENLAEEIAPGCCWQDNQALALTSIRKLKSLAGREKAQLWPNHDIVFYLDLPQFPAWRD